MIRSQLRLFAPLLGLVLLAAALSVVASIDYSSLRAAAEPAATGVRNFPIKNPIDKFILQRLQEDKIETSGLCSDEEFLRRAYLDVCGVIPSRAQTKEFLADRSSDKRAKLIDKLLKSERYADHWAVLWGDLLREHTNSRPQEGTERGSYREWLQSALRRNLPYDQFVKELLTSTGSSDDNAAVNFFLRDSESRVETVNTIANIFMGTRLSCAQCHDHPFDKWQQTDFHGMMAFFGRTVVGPDPVATLLRVEQAKRLPEEARKLLEPHFKEAHEMAAKEKEKLKSELASGGGGMGMGMMGAMAGMGKGRDAMREIEKSLTPQMAQQVRQVFQQNQVRQVLDKPLGEYKMPSEGDSQDKKKKGGDIVQPTFPWDLSKKVPATGSRRVALAEFLVTNRQFAQVQVNRLWAQLMGRGIVDPVDDFRAKNPPTHPELLDYLADEFVKNKFDNHHILRLILNSSAYQRSSVPTMNNRSDTTNYSHQKLRRLTAEQMFDSILVATGREKGLAGTPTGDIAGRIKERVAPRDAGVQWASDLPTPARTGTFLNTFNQPTREETIVKRDDSGSIPQALEMLNGQAINNAVKNSPLVKELADSKLHPNQIACELYLSVLSRNPSNTEMSTAATILNRAADAKEKREIIEDLMWAMLNAREFAFVK
ncbi:MAG TPA: DUF1549 and DUF1553 domain-containing protein [Planctomycetota bacterium]|nr:DUF1549 and DUF1553 domain-containing protein [Planctomycetota bacterium]